jgi:hypothetical protein
MLTTDSSIGDRHGTVERVREREGERDRERDR